MKQSIQQIKRVYFLVTALRWLAVGLVLPISVLVMQSRGINLMQLGIIMGLYAVTIVLLELPTGGLARAAGPLSVEDFGSWRQVQNLTETGLSGLLPTIAALADAEGFTAHRMAAELRFAEPTG